MLGSWNVMVSIQNWIEEFKEICRMEVVPPKWLSRHLWSMAKNTSPVISFKNFPEAKGRQLNTVFLIKRLRMQFYCKYQISKSLSSARYPPPQFLLKALADEKPASSAYSPQIIINHSHIVNVGSVPLQNKGSDQLKAMLVTVGFRIKEVSVRGRAVGGYLQFEQLPRSI